jgi:TP901 family phage tail tape measure protein
VDAFKFATNLNAFFIMSLKIDRYQLEIDVKPNKSQQELQALNDLLSESKRKLTEIQREKEKVTKSLSKENGKDAAERDYNKISLLKDKMEELTKAENEQIAAVKKAKVALDTQLEKIGIAGMTLKQLTDRQRDLNYAVRNMVPNGAEYTKYKAQLDAINTRIKELKGNANATKFSLSKMADGFNKYAAIAATTVASLTGIIMTARQSVQDFADMKEAESQVIKYTGMTAAEVDELNEEFKKMDTRVSRERLNELAGDAGKLGIQGKQNILDFVDAAVQIDAALGEDLGKDAIKSIGKLANIFGDDKKIGLKQAMLGSGSAINQLGQESSAAEKYILDFTYRMSGSGKQAHMLQTDIMGLGAVLDQNGQQVETSATAVSQLMTKMYQEPAKFAKLASTDVKTFTTLLNKDGNAALMKFLDSMKSKGGFAQLAPMFESMQLNGARATGVLSTLASKTDDIRKAQKDAAQAYQEATSITQEYNKQNNTVQAGIDKAKKSFHEVSIELGERLEPIMKFSISSTSTLTKGMLAIAEVVAKYRGAIIGASAALAAYIVIEELSIIKAKIVAFWNNAVAVSFKKIWAVLAANPWGAVAVALGVVIGLYIDLTRKSNELSKSQQSLKNIEDSANEKIAEQKGMVETLSKIVHDNNQKLKDRLSAINELKNIVPGYNAQISQEGKVYNENTVALNEYINKLKEKALLEGAQDEIKNLAKQELELQKKRTEARNKYIAAKKYNQEVTDNPYASSDAAGGLINEKSALSDYKEAGRNLRDTDKAMKDVIIYTTKLKSSVTTSAGGTDTGADTGTDTGTDTGAGTGGGTGKGGGKNDPYDRDVQAAELAYKKKILLLKKQLQEGAITEKEYHDKSYSEEQSSLATKLTIQKKYNKDTTDTETEMLDKMVNETDYQYNEKKKQQEEDLNKELASLDDSYNADKMLLAQQRLNGEITDDDEYKSKLEEAEKDYWQQKLAIIRKNGADETEILQTIYDKELQDGKDSKEKMKGISDKAYEQAKSTEEKSLINENAFANGLISYEDYEKRKTAIAQEEADKRQAVTNAAFQVINDLTSSASQLFQSMQSRETSKVENKYKKLIAAAKKAGKDTTKLEEKEEEEKAAIKKKYADKEFRMTAISIVAKTAEAVMTVTKEWAWNPLVEGLLISSAVLQGAMQLAVAKNARDEAAGLYEGGYEEGYTKKTNPRNVTGVIPVHGGEWVANHTAVANPHVRQFLDVFDQAQHDGSIEMMDTTAILEKVRYSGGRYSGGYTAANSGNEDTAQGSGMYVSIADMGAMLEYMKAIEAHTKDAAEKDALTIRDVMKKIKHINTLEQNASR